MHPDDLYDPLFENHAQPPEDEAAPSRPSRFRLAIYSLLMLAILVASSLLSTASALPSFLGYWQSHYQIRIQQIQAGDCKNATNNPSGIIGIDQNYCVCGLLDAGTEDADFSLNLYQSKGQRLGVIHLQEQKSGHFCQSFSLKQSLAQGDYEVRVIPRLSRQSVYRIRFSVQDTNPTI